MITVPGRKFWELEENLPTGRTLDLFGSRDLRVRRRFADLHLDDVLTDLDMCQRGEIRRGGISVQMWDHSRISRACGVHAAASASVLYRAVHVYDGRDSTCRHAASRPVGASFRPARIGTAWWR